MNDEQPKTPTGIKDFIAQTATVGNIIIGAASSKNATEPLPFTDYSKFNETLNENCLKLNINLYSNQILKRIFIPNENIFVEVAAERKHGPRFLHPYIYTLTFTHSTYKWSVIRSYKEIKEVHRILARDVKQDLGKSLSDISQIESDWPLFPTEHDHMVSIDNIEERCKKLAEYLRRILTYPPFRDNPATLHLLSVSPISFTLGLGQSLIEGILAKRTGDNIYYGNCSRLKLCCDNVKIFHTRRWFCIKDTYIAYFDLEKNFLCRFVMLVDLKFQVKEGVKAGALHSITLRNSQRTLVLKCRNSQQQEEWKEKIEMMLRERAIDFIQPNELRSFAPPRRNQKCRWYVNAKDYMESVMSALNAAKEEIYITDWWFSPELYLKRPTTDLQYRLDKILISKAQQDVKVYILLYKEVELALGLKSFRVKQELMKHKNIKVLRHPDHTPSGVFLWSHHEKSVIIDQSIGFMGGIDLCFGRWDDDRHRLIDLGKKENITELQAGTNGRMYTQNDQVSDQQVNIDVQNDIANRQQSTPNLSQAQYAFLISALSGKLQQQVSDQVPPVAKPRSKFMFRRRSHHDDVNESNDDTRAEVKNESVTISNDILINESSLTKQDSIDDESKRNKIKTKWNRLKENLRTIKEDIRKNDSDSDADSLDNEAHNASQRQQQAQIVTSNDYYWIGKDYSNTYQADFKNVELFAEDQFDRTKVPRMPWRDEALLMQGESARDLARHFIQRWNQSKREKVNKNDEYPYLIPKSYDQDLNVNSGNLFKELSFTCDLQLCRSLDSWSGGIIEREDSILSAYKDLIEKAEHFIYIENQFFVTTCDERDDLVRNQIGQYLVQRIEKAHRESKKFRVYIVLPLLPGFETNSNAIQAVQYFNLRSINLGKYSIYKKLNEKGISNASDYITIHGMRNWDVLMGNLVTEIIYVHSKLMIVDDRYAICGSANINDRSLLGSRDSELACVIKDTEFIKSSFNGEEVKVGKYCQSLRKKIFKLHLGSYFDNSSKINVNDCTSDEFYRLFQKISSDNTNAYDEVFKCIPSDNIKTFKDLYSYGSNIDRLAIKEPKMGKELLQKKVKGFLVDFPLEFLSNEANFFPQLNTAEGLAPTTVWT